jgi:phage-related protein
VTEQRQASLHLPWQVVSQQVAKLKVRFYATAAGNKVFAEDLDGLGADARAEVVRAIGRRSRGEQLPREDELVAGRIRAIRTTFDGCEYRTLYGRVGPHDEVLLCLYVLNKKSRKIPSSAVKLASRRLADWEAQGRALRARSGATLAVSAKTDTVGREESHGKEGQPQKRGARDRRRRRSGR